MIINREGVRRNFLEYKIVVNLDRFYWSIGEDFKDFFSRV